MEHTPLLAQLARETAGWTLESLPESVVCQARLCLLDTAGCVIAGTQTEEAALVLACEPAAHSADSASVLGTSERRPVASAVRVNGYLGDILELNDLIGGHASIGNVVAALALAEAEGSDLAALLEAIVRGIEVTTRIYNAVYPSLKRFAGMGLVPVGIPSAIGAAAAASHVLSLDETQTAHAMAIAGSLAGWCPAEVIFGDGGTVKPLLFGAQPGSTGVAAAFQARAGMTGPLRLLESPLGYFATVADAASMPPGLPWALLEPRRKLHACCGYLHAAIDGTARLRPRLAALPGAWTLEVRIPAYTLEAVAKSRPPLSPNDARFHMQYMLAIVLDGADVIIPEHSIRFAEWIATHELGHSMARIHVLADPSITHYHRCHLVLRAEDGSVIAEQFVEAPKGAPKQPMGDDEVVEKFARLANPVIGPKRTTRSTEIAIHDDGKAPVADLIANLLS